MDKLMAKKYQKKRNDNIVERISISMANRKKEMMKKARGENGRRRYYLKPNERNEKILKTI